MSAESKAVQQALEEAAQLHYSPADPLPYYDFIADHLLESGAFYTEQDFNDLRDDLLDVS